MRTELRAGQVLTVTAGIGGNGTLQQLAPSGSTVAYPQTSIAESSSVSIGPFTEPRNYEIGGRVTYAITEPDEEQVLGDTPGGLFANPMVIPNGKSETVPENCQVVIFDSFTALGTVIINGVMRICSYPA